MVKKVSCLNENRLLSPEVGQIVNVRRTKNEAPFP
jgi:hypothetical protein